MLNSIFNIFYEMKTYVKPKGLDLIKTLLKERLYCTNSKVLNKNNVAI